ncbi:AraC family transcriptional regulator [Leptospira sp. 201903070]|uniref:AraC family transcriptional regulator n=1 Tax=Leptospira ainlahdjerensis TaxID=2810033 RepID=A0ABS2UG47_9LEPT|nr:helix-turn-helix domain-containing protein [Leptospira ainlahdjerensis]MBM9579351.1 AraC family transcriptional regulator [Leptospira ainlahdjerensis]
MKILFSPCDPELTPWIGCYWGWESDSDSASIQIEFPKIFPSVENEIHISYRDPILFGTVQEGMGEWNSSQGHIIGNHLSPFLISPQGKVGFFNIRMFPGSFYEFFKIPGKEVRSHLNDLQIPNNNRYSDFVNRIRDSNSFDERVVLSNEYFRKLLNSKKETEPVIVEAVRRIANSKGRIPISQLTQDLGVIKKTLERKFQERIGYNPKEFARVVRFQNAAWMKLENQNLSELALSAGYYDQSHLTKEFGALSGYSPLVWYGVRDRVLSLFYNTRPHSF